MKELTNVEIMILSEMVRTRLENSKFMAQVLKEEYRPLHVAEAEKIQSILTKLETQKGRIQRQHKTTVGRICSIIPGNEEIIVRDYLTNRYLLKGTASEICEDLNITQEIREANVYGIRFQDGAITIDMLPEE